MNKPQTAKRITATIFILLMICLSSIPVFAATPTLLQCDLNGDKIVNTSDLIDISNHMRATGTPGLYR
jgi:hypothetical protein